jgi:peptidoglycan hydrolase-like protein with peptidoglycan-binding domain
MATTIYKQGVTNPYVGTIQKSLADMGYNVGPIDNIYGPQTAGAVKQFQTAQSVPPQAGGLVGGTFPNSWV